MPTVTQNKQLTEKKVIGCWKVNQLKSLILFSGSDGTQIRAKFSSDVAQMYPSKYVFLLSFNFTFVEY